MTATRPLNLCIMTVSDSRTEANDTSGDLLVERLQTAGHQLFERTIVKDDIYAIRAIVSQWITNSKVDVIVTTGGTGITSRDSTPEALQALFDKELTGFGEMFRMVSYQDIGTSALQSRSVAGVANGTYIFALPGSNNACRTGWDLLIGPQLDVRTQPCNLVHLMPRLSDA